MPIELAPGVQDAVDRAFTVNDACERLGNMSRSQFYAELRAGRIVAHKIGSRTVVRQTEITRYLDTLPTAGLEDA